MGSETGSGHFYRVGCLIISWHSFLLLWSENTQLFHFPSGRNTRERKWVTFSQARVCGQKTLFPFPEPQRPCNSRMLFIFNLPGKNLEPPILNSDVKKTGLKVQFYARSWENCFKYSSDILSVDHLSFIILCLTNARGAYGSLVRILKLLSRKAFAEHPSGMYVLMKLLTRKTHRSSLAVA